MAEETVKNENALETTDNSFEDDLVDAFADDLGGDKALVVEEIKDVADEFQLAQDLKGFASCFPEWDLYPPKDK